MTTPLSDLSSLWLVSGANIVVNTRIVAVDTVNNIITMSQPATASATFIYDQPRLKIPTRVRRISTVTSIKPWWDRTRSVGPDRAG